MAGKVLKLVGLAALAAAVGKVLKDRSSEPTWHSTPVAVPTPKPARDAAGSSPDEAAADAVETPHVPTTPDAPAETVVLEE